MGIISSRLNIESLGNNNGNGGSNGGRRRRRSQQDETLYSYSLSKNYFSNYFLMNGERFEANDPDYLFGENCDLNFLSCIKPYYFPYKQAQQDLLSNLAKSKQQKANNKATNRVTSRLNSLIGRGDIMTGRRQRTQSSTNENSSGNGSSDNNTSDTALKQDAQTQTLNSSKGFGKNGETPLAQPLVMFVNIRKETLRLVKLSNACNLDSDLNSLTNYPTSSSSNQLPLNSSTRNSETISSFRLIKNRRQPSSLSKHSKTSLSHQQEQKQKRISASSSKAANSNVYQDEVAHYTLDDDDNHTSDDRLGISHLKDEESEGSSLLSATSSTRSGYASVREDRANSVTIIMDSKTNNDASSNSSDDDDDKFVDALNDTVNLSTSYELDDLDKNQQQSRSLLTKQDRTPSKFSTKENRDIKITIEPINERSATDNTSDSIKDRLALTTADTNSVGAKEKFQGGETLAEYSSTSHDTNRKSTEPTTSKSTKKLTEETTLSLKPADSSGSNRVYNIEFCFDAEVDCSIRIFYFCTREVTSTGITYKPQHATYKSKVYNYRKGLNQKFDQQEHTFQPYLFDEDLLIYKPLDVEGNYNSGAVFPIVIHIVALDGPTPRQSQSLVATIEKSQLDDSYSIKPLKQLIFVDGVQYILQDIYGIEHKQMVQSSSPPSSLITSSMTNSTTSNAPAKSNSATTVECVICMSDERDTILLPCRHLCLCSSCAQSLRHQSSSCPICRCPFKAALNLQYESRS